MSEKDGKGKKRENGELSMDYIHWAMQQGTQRK